MFLWTKPQFVARSFLMKTKNDTRVPKGNIRWNFFLIHILLVYLCPFGKIWTFSSCYDGLLSVLWLNAINVAFYVILFLLIVDVFCSVEFAVILVAFCCCMSSSMFVELTRS